MYKFSISLKHWEEGRCKMNYSYIKEIEGEELRSSQGHVAEKFQRWE